MPRFLIEADYAYTVVEAENKEIAACNFVLNHGTQRRALQISSIGNPEFIHPKVAVTLIDKKEQNA